MVINLNLTHKDPELRKLFDTKDFRIALSLGIDRRAIIEAALLGEGEPWQNGPFETHPNFHERIATQYLEHDPKKANALLDGLGLQRGPDGVRRLPSGRPLKFKVDVIPTLQPEQVDMLQLIERQWAQIGVDMDVNALERTFFYERTSNSNDHDAAAWGGQASWVPGEIPQQIVPVHHDSRWGIPWTFWYESGGKQVEERPPSVKERMRLYDEARHRRSRQASGADPQDRRHRRRRVRGDERLEGAADLRDQEGQSQERAQGDAELLVLSDPGSDAAVDLVPGRLGGRTRGTAPCCWPG